MKVLVSVIIVNWNGGEVFKNCIASLSAIDYPNWELIVVDNGSKDKSYSNIKAIKNSKLIKNKSNVGFAPANNQGYKVSRGEYILLLNNDTKVSSDFLSKLINRMEGDSSIGVIQPKIYLMEKKGYLDNAGSFITKIGFLSHWGFGAKDSKEFDYEAEIFSAKGACMLIRREVIEKVGLFDPDFVSYFEESDLCFRVWLAGWRVLYYPKTYINHKLGFTIKRVGPSDLNYHYYKNRISSLIKNLELFNLLTILPVHLFISLGISVLFLLRGGLDSSLLITRAILWNVFNLPEILKKRHKAQALREVSDGEIFRRVGRRVNWGQFFGDFKRVEKDIKES